MEEKHASSFQDIMRFSSIFDYFHLKLAALYLTVSPHGFLWPVISETAWADLASALLLVRLVSVISIFVHANHRFHLCELESRVDNNWHHALRSLKMLDDFVVAIKVLESLLNILALSLVMHLAPDGTSTSLKPWLIYVWLLLFSVFVAVYCAGHLWMCSQWCEFFEFTRTQTAEVAGQRLELKAVVTCLEYLQVRTMEHGLNAQGRPHQDVLTATSLSSAIKESTRYSATKHSAVARALVEQVAGDGPGSDNHEESECLLCTEPCMTCMRCCASFTVCEACLETWFTQSGPTCPHCRRTVSHWLFPHALHWYSVLWRWRQMTHLMGEEGPFFSWWKTHAHHSFRESIMDITVNLQRATARVNSLLSS